MSAATLAEIQDALADTIAASLVTVTDIDIQVASRFVLSPTLPCVDIYPGPVDQTTAGMGDAYGDDTIVVRARVSPADIEAGQDLLLDLLDDDSDLSLAAAIFTDDTLNGTVSSVTILARSEMVAVPRIDQPGLADLGATITLAVTKAYS